MNAVLGVVAFCAVIAVVGCLLAAATAVIEREVERLDCEPGPAERSRVMMPAREADRWALVRGDAVLYWTTGQDSGWPLCEYEEAA